MAFLPNPDAVPELMEDELIREGLGRAVEPARELAEHYAPGIMDRPGRRQIEVVVREDGVYLANTAYGAAIEEFGSRNNPPYAPLRRAAQEAGIRFEEAPKPT